MNILSKWLIIIMIIAIVGGASYGGYLYATHYTSDFIDVTLDSQELNESRKIFIRLPTNFDPQVSYPLIIKTDGNFNLQRWDQQLTLLTTQYDLQDVIVVSIPNHWWKKTRNRDLVPPYARRDVNIDPRPTNETTEPQLGQADKFLGFISNEVLPYLEQNYRLNQHRSLSGFSAGGSFVLYTMVTKPQLFDAYFSFSPAAWYDDGEVVKQTAKNLHKLKGKYSYFYLSLGANEGEIITTAFAGLKQALIAHAPENLHWQYEITPDADHVHNPFASLPNALQGYYQFMQQVKP
jgi:predicted alpha/beta superfamily hydrolase